MFYSEAIDYIKNIERLGSDFGIERMRELLILLGEPDRALKFVHIAGTNGKGSVSSFMTSILKCAGFKVGTYNSPSVFSYNERFLIDGTPICDSQVAKFMTVVREAIVAEQDKRKQCNPQKVFAPTAFEIETALAFLCFLDEGCDVCVLETGLGGRWDATNVIFEKELAIITPIGLDHCALLGNTVGEIASEKAAIIHNDAVTCQQCDEVMQSLCKPFQLVDGKKIFTPCLLSVCLAATPIACNLDGQDFCYDGKNFHIRLLGDHQLQNASIAICAARLLAKKGWNISDKNIADGLALAVWHGRLEIVKDAQQRFNISVPNGKTLVLDGAHNPHGANRLAETIKKYFAGKTIHLVIGILADKDVDGILRELLPIATRVTAVTPPSPRALSGEKLKGKISLFGKQVDCLDDTHIATAQAVEAGCDVIVVCGSLTLFSAL